MGIVANLMSIFASKGDNKTPLLNLCKERKQLIRAARDARFHLTKSHLLYFQSLLDFSNALNDFVHKDLVVIPYSSDDSSSELICSGSDSDSDSDSDADCLVCDGSQPGPVSNNGGNKVEQVLEPEFVSVSKDDQDPQKPVAQGNQTCGSSNNVGLGFFEEENFVSAPVEDVMMRGSQNPSFVEQNSFAGPDIFGLYDPVYKTQCDTIEPDHRDEVESDGLREVREREGIPDLEPDSDHNSLVRKNQKKKKKKKTRNNVKETSSSTNVAEEIDKRGMKLNVEESSSIGNVVGAVGTSNVEESPSIANVVDEVGTSNVEASPCHNGEVASNDDGSRESCVQETQKTPEIDPEETRLDEEVCDEGYESSSSSFSEPSDSGLNDLRKIVEKINCICEKATSSSEMSELLEASKVVHHQALGDLFKGFASRVLGTSKYTRILLSRRGLCQEDLAGSLSMTLEKLYMWEKKVYAEVLVEEELRVLYDKAYKILKHLDQTGAESNKIDEARAVVKLHLSNINVSVRAVESFSMRIHKIRDEELWFQVIGIINGFKEMWRFLAKCHHKQFRAIARSKSCVHIVEKGSSSRKATQKVEEQIRRYKESLRCYIDAQRGFVKHLNEWLNRNIMEDDDETEVEAPEIFRVCREWLREIESVEEVKVLSAVEEMGSRFRGLGLKQVEEEKQRMGTERLCKELQKKTSEVEELWGTKANDSEPELLSLRESVTQEREKHERVIRELNDAVSSSLQECLVPVFEALEDFCFRNFMAYQNIRIVSTETLLLCQS
ncbi:hypothetical protein AALP_AA8G329000 [Arabis alpina]|uniref:DUF632 domain-containing protein n=1 Tax=Arabis alpina TaxID=50452 RepID=A0A087GB07_ARAAL|nr:hypothetical protein AALP_AA8G329000 [Arabis alpina]